MDRGKLNVEFPEVSVEETVLTSPVRDGLIVEYIFWSDSSSSSLQS
jgi:hypothetical protein